MKLNIKIGKVLNSSQMFKCDCVLYMNTVLNEKSDFFTVIQTNLVRNLCRSDSTSYFLACWLSC